PGHQYDRSGNILLRQDLQHFQAIHVWQPLVEEQRRVASRPGQGQKFTGPMDNLNGEIRRVAREVRTSQVSVERVVLSIEHMQDVRHGARFGARWKTCNPATQTPTLSV